MKTEKYECGKKIVEVEFFTDAAEIPYQRYMLSVKMAILANGAALNHESVESDINNAMQMLSSGKQDKAMFFLQAAKNRINFASQGWMLDLAATFPLIKSIDGEIIAEVLSVDACTSLAEKYKFFLPVDVLKKKVK